MKKLAVLLFLISGLVSAQLINLQSPKGGSGLSGLIISGTPPPIDYLEVADAPARLSLLGIDVGYRVHQLDNNTIYQYNGPSTDDVAGMIVSGAGVSNGIYVIGGQDANSIDYYTLLGAVSVDVNHNSIAAEGKSLPSLWQIFDNGGGAADASAVEGNTPDAATGWSIATVTIDHIASESNWSVVP